MNILFVSAEVAPFSKAGGLADVAGSLPQALSHYVASIQVISPLYGQIDCDKYSIIPTSYKGSVELGEDRFPYTLHSTTLTDGKIQNWFIENETFFGRQGIYTEENGAGFEDNNLRYYFFQLVVLDVLKRQLFNTDLLHCNDHHSGLLPGLLKSGSSSIRSVFTIHNFLYHGHFSERELELLPNDLKNLTTKTQWDNYSALLEGIDHADLVTTVSSGYARELLSGEDIDSHSHKHILAAQNKFSGVVNGIDTEYWNPELDSFTPFHFSQDRMDGKLKNKRELLAQSGLDLDESAPLIGSISRLVENKGFPFIVDLLDEFVAAGAQFIFLGSGDPVITEQLHAASKKHPGRIAFDAGFNEPLAHLIEAGSDLFLMPSRFEPCGLNQLYSLRYGTIPIVHNTGGLGDTVKNYKLNAGTGFVFEPYTLAALKSAINQALDIFIDKKQWAALIKRAMDQDFSWGRSALQYYKLYTSKR